MDSVSQNATGHLLPFRVQPLVVVGLTESAASWLVSNCYLSSQAEEGVAEKKVFSQKWPPDHLPRHGKTPPPVVWSSIVTNSRLPACPTRSLVVVEPEHFRFSYAFILFLF